MLLFTVLNFSCLIHLLVNKDFFYHFELGNRIIDNIKICHNLFTELSAVSNITSLTVYVLVLSICIGPKYGQVTFTLSTFKTVLHLVFCL